MGFYLRAGTFWAFGVGAYSKWVLIQRWAVNRINTIKSMPRRLHGVQENWGHASERIFLYP